MTIRENLKDHEDRNPINVGHVRRKLVEDVIIADEIGRGDRPYC